MQSDTAIVLEKKLGLLESNTFVSPELLALVSRVARRQAEAQAQARVSVPERGLLAPAQENLQGRPLLPRAEFPVDRGQADSLFEEFLALFEELAGNLGAAAQAVRQAMQAGELDLDAAFAALLAGDDAPFLAFAERTPGAPLTLHFLAQAALTPGVTAAAAQLAAHLDPEATRMHGHCPVCGSLPLITTLTGKEGARQATCSFCRTAYRIRRLACPFCDHAEPKGTRTFSVKEIPGYRVEVCDSCKSYIKTTDFRELDLPSVPVLDDLESLPLDILAQDQGFKRPTLSAWGF